MRNPDLEQRASRAFGPDGPFKHAPITTKVHWLERGLAALKAAEDDLPDTPDPDLHPDFIKNAIGMTDADPEARRDREAIAIGVQIDAESSADEKDNASIILGAASLSRAGQEAVRRSLAEIEMFRDSSRRHPLLIPKGGGRRSTRASAKN